MGADTVRCSSSRSTKFFAQNIMEPVEESQAIPEFQSNFQIKDFKTPCVCGFKVECFAWGSLWKSPLLLFLLKDGII